MSTQQERKIAYEKSAVRQLMESQGHEICPRCYCCDLISTLVPCWQCNGLEEEDELDYFLSGPCSVCKGELTIADTQCIGGCDENGNHEVKGK
jgi:hypothetical protein